MVPGYQILCFYSLNYLLVKFSISVRYTFIYLIFFGGGLSGTQLIINARQLSVEFTNCKEFDTGGRRVKRNGSKERPAVRERSVQFPGAWSIRQKQTEFYCARCVNFYNTLALSPHISPDTRAKRLSSLGGAPSISAKRHNGFHQAASFQRVGDSCLLSVLPAYQFLAGGKEMNGFGRGGPSRLPLRVTHGRGLGLPGKTSRRPESQTEGSDRRAVPTSLRAGAAPVYPVQLLPLHRGPVEVEGRRGKADKTDAFRPRRRGDTAGSDTPHHYNPHRPL